MNTVAFVFTPRALVLAVAVSAGCGGGGGTTGGTTPAGGTAAARQALASIEAKSGSTLVGTATFTAEGDNKVKLDIEVTGAPPGEHAVHLHEKGDCSAPDAMSAGEHWNPTNEAHGKWGSAPFHLGDIGNMKVGDDGRGSLSFTADKWTIGTGAMDDVVGHSIVIHGQPDDFTTQPAGAAGTRLGCGVVRQK